MHLVNLLVVLSSNLGFKTLSAEEQVLNHLMERLILMLALLTTTPRLCSTTLEV